MCVFVCVNVCVFVRLSVCLFQYVSVVVVTLIANFIIGMVLTDYKTEVGCRHQQATYLHHLIRPSANVSRLLGMHNCGVMLRQCHHWMSRSFIMEFAGY